MGVFSGLVRFGKGGVLGAAIGAAAGLLLAPGSGKETRSALSERIQRTRLAGVDAKSDVEQDLIQRFRGKVSDSEENVPDSKLENYIVSWPLKWPKGAKG